LPGARLYRHCVKVVVAHNRYRSAQPSGENRMVDTEIEQLTAAGVEVIPFLRSSDDIPALPAAGKALLPLADVLVVNETEALQLLDESATAGDWPAVAGALLALGPSSVVVTLGADGAILAEAGGETRSFPAPAVAVVDTTGAGDAFCGALAARLAAGAALAEAAAAGVVAGSLAVTTAGAQPSMPTREAIERALRA
jgi:ribokinase